jgi:hypothetical protein
VGLVAELRGNALEDLIGAFNIGWVRLPLGVRHLVTRVIEAGLQMTISDLTRNEIRIPFIPVLTSRDAVEIDYNLKTVIPCPLDSLKEIFVLPLDIRLVGCDFVGPIPYWDAHVIEPEARIQT